MPLPSHSLSFIASEYRAGYSLILVINPARHFPVRDCDGHVPADSVTVLPTESKMLFLLSGLRNSRSHSAEKLPGVSTKGRNPIGSWTHQIIIRTFKALPLKPSYNQ